MVNKLRIRFTKNKEEIDQSLKIRKRVFVEEQKVEPEIEFDGLDSKAKHVLVFLDKKPIGCARVRKNKCVKLERIAILKEYRNKGFGRQLMEYLVNYCENKGYSEICLHSQMYIVDFYKKCGFKPRGKTFLEAGIKHIEMYMQI